MSLPATTLDAAPAPTSMALIDFRTAPDRYRHWRLRIEPPLAHLTLDVVEDGGLRDNYTLKQNSYDLGVDIELYDAIAAAALRAPRGEGGDRRLGQGADLLRRRQHPDARRSPRTSTR